MIQTWITTEPLNPAQIISSVGTPHDGAVLVFLGTVRQHNRGRAVTGMHYDAYTAMAEQVLREIVQEAASRWELSDLTAAHRIGDLTVGEVSVVIAVASPHRAESYEASRYVIEEIKQRLPVWKQEHYAGGAQSWLEGADPRAESRRE